MEHEKGERGGHVLGVLKLAGMRLALIAHAAAGIEQKIGLEVGLLLVFLDVVAVRLAVGPPMEVADFIAGIILAVFGKLDGKALVRAFVHAGEESLDKGPRNQREPAIFPEFGWIETHAILLCISRSQKKSETLVV